LKTHAKLPLPLLLLLLLLLFLLFGVYSCAKQRSVASVTAKSETPYTYTWV